MAPRYLNVVRALTASVVLAACGRRPDPFEPATPLATPGAALLDASMQPGTVTTLPAMPIAIPPPPAPTPAPTPDPEIAFKQAAMALGCPATLPSGTCPATVVTYNDCRYDMATTGLASRGSMVCRCSSGTWYCAVSRFGSRVVRGPLEPPELGREGVDRSPRA